jgi:multiple sugar transport system permease protein
MAKMVAMRKRRMWRDAFLLVIPFLTLYGMFFLYPTYRVAQLSLTNTPLIGSGDFVGFENYRRLLSDYLFWQSLRNTMYFVVLTVIPNTALGLVFALMVIRLKHLKPYVLAAFFLPYFLPVSVVTLIWQWLLDTQFGIAQNVFATFIGSRVPVFADAGWAMPMVALITVWWTVGFNTLLFIAGLQGISSEYYEAASLDGASSFQIFRHVTWPLLWPVTTLVLTLQLIAQLKIFDQVYLLTQGGPYNSTLVTLQYMYREAFQRFNGGYASAVAMALFIVILLASIIQYKFLRTGGER